MQASERAKKLEKQQKQKRSKQPLSREHAKKVRKEVEHKPVNELQHRIKRMKTTRERMQKIKREKLKEIQRRTAVQFRKKVIEQMSHNTDFMKMESVRREHMPNHQDKEHQDLIKMSEKAAELVRKLQENQADLKAAKQLKAMMPKFNKQANLALNRERHPERFESQQQQNNPVSESQQKTQQEQSAQKQSTLKSQNAQNKQSDNSSARRQPQQGSKSEQFASKQQQGSKSDQQTAGKKSDTAKQQTAGQKNQQESAKGSKTPPVIDQIDHPMTVATKKLMALAESLVNQPNMSKMNDVSSAQNRKSDSSLSKQNLAKLNKMSSKELYELGKKLEADIEASYKDARAADLAMRQNTSFNDAAAKLAEQKENNTENLDNALALAESLKNIGELSKYRSALDKAVQQTRASDMRTSSMLHQARGSNMKLGGGTPGGGGAYAVGDNSGPSAQGGPGGYGGGSDPDHIRQAGGQFMKNLDSFRRMGISREMVQAQALPGRKFTKSSPRSGWLYINTWYIIGPWENGGRIDYSNIHPPEFEIDFDAVYTDGKKGQVYTSRKVFEQIDGKLSWRFTQSDNLRVLPPIQSPDSTFYAYTELYFEEDTEMLVAIASDDATRVWINGELTWEELGLSSWNIGERFERAFFHKGTNKILLRLENGPSETLFSFVICPPEALQKHGG
jgi:hypothetical protein